MAKPMTEDDFMELGMTIGGYDQWRFYTPTRNLDNFKDCFGATPKTCEQIWEDLDQRLQELTKYSKPMHLLLGLRFLFRYPTEKDLGRTFKIRSDYQVRTLCKEWSAKIQLTLSLKMLSWEEADNGMIFFMSVDGTHCPIEEPRPLSTIWSSHKFGGHAAVNYEVGLSICRQKLIWVYGPTCPGALNDLDVAREQLIPAMRNFTNGRVRKFIADGIYGAEDVMDVVTTKNEYDPREIEEFKDRVCSRHEAFNKLLKLWGILKLAFRHDLERHRTCFEAVAAIICYQLDNGSYSLFDPYPTKV